MQNMYNIIYKLTLPKLLKTRTCQRQSIIYYTFSSFMTQKVLQVI